jgi:PPOX class probable F420-dependent enzyme
MDERVRQLLDGKNLAYVATREEQGHPRVQTTCVGREGDLILLNTEDGRKRLRQLRQEPRAAIAVANADDPTGYVEIIGRVAFETTDGARQHMDALSQRYFGVDYPMHFDGERRVMIGIAPERINSSISRGASPGFRSMLSPVGGASDQP